MNNKQYQEKITILNKWANAYYVDDNPIATDEEYDKLHYEEMDCETPYFTEGLVNKIEEGAVYVR